jgi:NADPH:quinone reductase-like Zn-dependent oxidoreductase
VLFRGTGGADLLPVIECSFNRLKPGGRYVTTAASQEQLTGAQGRGIEAYITFIVPGPGELSELAELIDAGKLRIFIARTFPLEAVQAALEFKPPAWMPGKVVITIGQPTSWGRHSR